MPVPGLDATMAQKEQLWNEKNELLQNKMMLILCNNLPLMESNFHIFGLICLPLFYNLFVNNRVLDAKKTNGI